MNCTDYFERESNFSKPMPFIGVYIAAASLACGVLILADLVYGARHHKLWFPSRYFSLNATSLTIVGVATKLSVDLNTSMPGRSDQLAKLTTSLLLCVSMSIFIPSLGQMGNTELIANLIALVILVTTVIVNICIQLRTGVIYTLIPGHIVALGSMVYILLLCYSTAIALASIKDHLRIMYERMQRVALDKFRAESSSESIAKRLEEYLLKFSVMSHTGWPDMVLGRSRINGTAAFICYVDAICLCSMLAVYALRPSPIGRSTFCNGESDYKWSTTLVISMQLFATLAGLYSLFPKIAHNPAVNYGKRYTIEGYWTQRLVEIKQSPFFLSIHNKECRKFVHNANYHFCNILIAIQTAMVHMMSIFGEFQRGISIFHRVCIGLMQWLLPDFNLSEVFLLTSPSKANLVELRPYVLYLEGEEKLTEPMMKMALNATSNCIEAGKKELPNHLMEFLRTSLSRGFEGVFRFDSDQVCSLDSQEPPTNCWSLPVVTMTSIAISLPGIDRCLVDKLLGAVREGLVFVKIIEENLNNSTDFINMRKAAEIVWQQVDIHGRRLDVKLNGLEGKLATDFLKSIADSANANFQTFKPRKEKIPILPIEAVALNSLYRVCQTMLLDCQNGNNQFHTTDNMFEMLSSRICDVLGACLTNLERSIITECSRSTIDNMNDTARCVLNLFGRTEEVMKLLDGKEKPNQLSSDQLVFIDKWQHSSDNMTNQLP